MYNLKENGFGLKLAINSSTNDAFQKQYLSNIKLMRVYVCLFFFILLVKNNLIGEHRLVFLLKYIYNGRLQSV